MFPAIWKVACITPLFKGGFRNNIKFYWAISLLPKVSLLFERILFIYLYSCLSKEFHPQQFGFQSHKKQSFNFWITSKKFLAVNLNTSFPFILTMRRPLIRSHTLSWLKNSAVLSLMVICTLLESYLCNRYQFTQVKKSKSKLLPCLSGVPQGTILGPFFGLRERFTKHFP